MIETRRDLSTWVLHFIHQANPENDPAYELNEGDVLPLFPFHEDKSKNARFDLWEISDEGAGLEPDASAFSVLMKILEDGHVRSGWSYRNRKPTIYGPRAATCFTEMPLFALIEYAQRRSADAVDVYAIGLLREELYKAGGRPVIYGLSGEHAEDRKPRRGTGIEMMDSWPRKLASSCGISENEQYRYVAMQLSGSRRIDWGHEREWRWADVADICSCPGLPLWLDNEPHQFSHVMVVVSTDKEAKAVLDKLKELHDAKAHNFGHEYDIKALAATQVIPLRLSPSQ